MKFKKFKLFLLLLSFIICSLSVIGQSISSNILIYKDYLRRLQLSEESEQNTSFTIYPISFKEFNNILNPLRYNGNDKLLNINNPILFRKLKINILPLSFLQQYNSHHPEEFNDGALIPASGLQSHISFGFNIEIGNKLQIQINPEFVYAANKSFLAFSTWYNGEFYPAPTINMDYPERFGTKAYHNILPGESFIRFNIRNFSFGLSTENLWWGPGMRNSLLMSNTAPGFFHFTFNTKRPLKTKIGSFEWQIICGRLDDSGYASDLPDDWRYINAMILSYSPKWIPGLFLGSIRSFMIYNKDMGSGPADYLPLFIPGGKSGDEFSSKREQMQSLFFRWVWKESMFELYGEYATNSHARTDYELNATSFTNAYILGFRKLFPLNKSKNTYLNLNVELTELGVSQTSSNLYGLSWYQHPHIKHGHTHRGQLLGAGIGPGSNLQSLKINWIRELKSIGLLFERYVHNNDFWYNAIKDVRNHWVDLSITTFCNWDYKNLLFNLNLKFVKSLNYQWEYIPPPTSFWGGKGLDPFNFHAKLAITYRF